MAEFFACLRFGGINNFFGRNLYIPTNFRRMCSLFILEIDLLTRKYSGENFTGGDKVNFTLKL